MLYFMHETCSGRFSWRYTLVDVSLIAPDRAYSSCLLPRRRVKTAEKVFWLQLPWQVRVQLLMILATL